MLIDLPFTGQAIVIVGLWLKGVIMFVAPSWTHHTGACSLQLQGLGLASTKEAAFARSCCLTG